MSVVYVIAEEDSDEFVKIGFSTIGGESRLVMQTGNPRKLYVVAEFEVAGMSDEKDLHGLFAEERVRGEWFRLSDRIRQWMATGLNPTAEKIVLAKNEFGAISIKEWNGGGTPIPRNGFHG